MLTAAEYKKILALHNQGQSIRSIRKHTGHSRILFGRSWISKPHPLFKVFLKPSIIDDYKDLIKAKFDVGTLLLRRQYMSTSSFRRRPESRMNFDGCRIKSGMTFYMFCCRSNNLSSNVLRGYFKKFETNGTEGLFDFSRKEPKKYEELRYKENVFKILHSPPSCYGFNRTTWRMEDLYQIMTQEDVVLDYVGRMRSLSDPGHPSRRT